MTPSNPLHYPRWIRVTPESEPSLVQNHHHHSAVTGQQYDENAELVAAKAPDNFISGNIFINPGPVKISDMFSPEEEERQIAQAAGELAAHPPTEEKAVDLGRPEDEGRFAPVDDDELAEMFAKPAPEADGEPKAKRTRKVRE